MTQREVRKLLPRTWRLAVFRQEPPGSRWAAEAYGPEQPRLGRPVQIAYFGAETKAAALAGLAHRLVTDQRPDRFSA